MTKKEPIQKVYKGFSNIATFRVWFEMVKRDLSTDGIGLFSISDDPLDIERAIADYYIQQAEKLDLSKLTKAFVADVNWEEITRRAIAWSKLDHAAQGVEKNTDGDYSPSNMPAYEPK